MIKNESPTTEDVAPSLTEATDSTTPPSIAPVETSLSNGLISQPVEAVKHESEAAAEDVHGSDKSNTDVETDHQTTLGTSQSTHEENSPADSNHHDDPVSIQEEPHAAQATEILPPDDSTSTRHSETAFATNITPLLQDSTADTTNTTTQPHHTESLEEPADSEAPGSTSSDVEQTTANQEHSAVLPDKDSHSEATAASSSPDQVKLTLLHIKDSGAAALSSTVDVESIGKPGAKLLSAADPQMLSTDLIDDIAAIEASISQLRTSGPAGSGSDCLDRLAKLEQRFLRRETDLEETRKQLEHANIAIRALQEHVDLLVKSLATEK